MKRESELLEQYPERVYFSIGEVADFLQVNQSLIRYWEKEFEVLNPKKNAKGNRLFSRGDVEQLMIIYELVKEQGFTLQGAKDKMKHSAAALQDNAVVIETLRELKAILLDIKEQL